MQSDKPTIGWILYDDSCGICRRWIPFWERTLGSRGYCIAPLQSDWVRQQLHLSDGALLRDLRLLLVDGRQIEGADVYRHVMKRIWWAYPASVLARAPILNRIFDLGYRTFATHRFRVSRACRLNAQHFSPTHSHADLHLPHR